MNVQSVERKTKMLTTIVKVKKETLLSLVLLLFILAIWEILSRTGVIHPLILPPASQVFLAI